AEAAFARAQAATGDRRFLQARGNCFFRADDLCRALWAFESAALGRPRDAELLANLALVRARLELPDGDAGFVAELDRLRQRLTATEQLAGASLCMLLAAGCLVFGWRRTGLRWIAALIALPGMWLLAALALQPAAGATAIALGKLSLTSEPRLDLDPVATVRPGVAVTVLGGSDGAFVRVRAGDRSGYVPRAAIAVVE
ncbi:MAG: SH3 domain-containing protein, partial [Planctomycetota bacterium]